MKARRNLALLAICTLAASTMLAAGAGAQVQWNGREGCDRGAGYEIAQPRRGRGRSCLPGHRVGASRRRRPGLFQRELQRHAPEGYRQGRAHEGRLRLREERQVHVRGAGRLAQRSEEHGQRRARGRAQGVSQVPVRRCECRRRRHYKVQRSIVSTHRADARPHPAPATRSFKKTIPDGCSMRLSA